MQIGRGTLPRTLIKMVILLPFSSSSAFLNILLPFPLCLCFPDSHTSDSKADETFFFKLEQGAAIWDWSKRDFCLTHWALSRSQAVPIPFLGNKWQVLYSSFSGVSSVINKPCSQLLSQLLIITYFYM